jgi:hypothetical protein
MLKILSIINKKEIVVSGLELELLCLEVENECVAGICVGDCECESLEAIEEDYETRYAEDEELVYYA